MRNAQSTLSVAVNPDGDTVNTGNTGNTVNPDHPPGDIVVIRLQGELDATSSPLLQTVVDQLLSSRQTPPCRTLVVDMSGVSFADASGLTPLLMARAMLVRRGGRVELRHGRRCLLRLLRTLGVDDMLEWEAG